MDPSTENGTTTVVSNLSQGCANRQQRSRSKIKIRKRIRRRIKKESLGSILIVILLLIHFLIFFLLLLLLFFILLRFFWHGDLANETTRSWGIALAGSPITANSTPPVPAPSL